MKKKLFINVLALSCCLALFSCASKQEQPNMNQTIPTEDSTTDITSDNHKNDERYNIYLLALNSGYSGTYEEWLNSIKGEQIVLSVKNNNIVWKYSSEDDSNYRLLINLVDLKGNDGEKGSNGKSAYEIAVDSGFSGSEADWLESLKGSNGSNGLDGNNGKSAYEIAVDNGFTGSEADWLESLKGSNGLDGNNGKSAYEIAVDNGFTGSKADWLESLKGSNGSNGLDGNNGKSAYEIAVDNGFTGSEADWLESLKGSNGSNGLDGNNGKSAYEIYCEKNPNYKGSEDEWIEDLITGKLYNESISLTGNFTYATYSPDSYYILSYEGADNYIEIPQTYNGYKIEAIGEKVFSENKQITSVILSKNIKEIKSLAFYNCTNLKDVYYNGTIEDWCKILFSTGSSNPTNNGANFYILDQNGDIEFNNKKYSLLTELVIPETIERILFASFRNMKNITNVTIPEGVTEIGSSSFDGCINLENITVPKSIEFIGLESFYKCFNLKNVYYNGTIENWCKIEINSTYYSPMYYATNFYMLDENGDIEYNGNKYKLLTEIEIPNSISTIGYGMLAGSKCTKVIIPSTITFINYYAFENCTNLTNITFNGTIEQWNNITKRSDWHRNVPTTVIHCTDGDVTI